MSESSGMYMVNLNEAIVMSSISFGSGAVFIEPHDCENEQHVEGFQEKIISIVVTDIHDNTHILVAPMESTVVRALTDLDIYYSIRAIVEDS